MLPLAFQACFVFLLAHAAISDYQRLKIPNWISIALFALFLIYAITTRTWMQMSWNFAIGGGVFLAAGILYTFGIFGGGDVKLLGAISLWMGPEHIFEFVTLTGLLGGVFGLLILVARSMVRSVPELAERSGPAWNIARWGRDGKCPYGIPIVIAAAIAGPTIFAG